MHFIHYVPRHVVIGFPRLAENPWFSMYQAPEDGFCLPKYHVSQRRTGPTRAVEPGDTVWLFGQIHSPWGTLPSGLDARIDVERIDERPDGALLFVAAPSSSWFPLKDATAILDVLDTVDGKRKTSKLRPNPTTPFGQVLQSMRRLVSVDALQAWSQNLSESRTDFISYRIADGTCGAFKKATDLLHSGKAVFWDRWCLPRRVAKRREAVSNPALDAYLMLQLKRSEVVWGIESDKYSAEGSYSAKEQSAAIDLGIYQAVPSCPKPYDKH